MPTNNNISPQETTARPSQCHTGSDQQPAEGYHSDLVAIAYIINLFFTLIGPVLLYLFKKEEESDQTKRALKNVINFSLTYLMASLGAAFIFFALMALLFLVLQVNVSEMAVFGIVLCLNVLIFAFVFSFFIFNLTGIIKNLRGKAYTPPLCIDFLK